MAKQHNNYDGIRYREEKRSPLVFRIIFFGLAAWGVLFIGYYLFSGWSSEKEFREKKKAREESLATATGGAFVHREGSREAYLAMGKALFAERCAVCHGPAGKGLIGPDLTRKDFKYGKGEADLVETITSGRPGGMPPFGNELSHEQVEGLVHYVLSL